MVFQNRFLKHTTAKDVAMKKCGNMIYNDLKEQLCIQIKS